MNPESGDVTPATVYLSIDLPPAVTPDELIEVRLALAHAARRSTAGGDPVRLLNAMYLPEHTSLLCAFTARSHQAVWATAGLANLAYSPVDPT